MIIKHSALYMYLQSTRQAWLTDFLLSHDSCHTDSLLWPLWDVLHVHSSMDKNGHPGERKNLSELCHCNLPWIPAGLCCNPDHIAIVMTHHPYNGENASMHIHDALHKNFDKVKTDLSRWDFPPGLVFTALLNVAEGRGDLNTGCPCSLHVHV